MNPEVLLPSIISGSAGLVGALIGSGAAILAGYLTDRRNWNRQDEDLDHDQRRDAYLQFLSACDRVHEGERGKEMFIELKRSGQNIKLVTRSKRVSEISEKMFLLLAPDALGDGLPAIKTSDRYDTLMQEFYEVARADLRKPSLREIS